MPVAGIHSDLELVLLNSSSHSTIDDHDALRTKNSREHSVTDTVYLVVPQKIAQVTFAKKTYGAEKHGEWPQMKSSGECRLPLAACILARVHKRDEHAAHHKTRNGNAVIVQCV